MTYLFETSATMKELDRKKWWIDADIVKPIYIEAETTAEALQKYCKILDDKYYILISKNAIKNKNAMYVDKNGEALQVGYVITGKTGFESNHKNIVKYIDLWVTIRTLTKTIF